MFGLCLPTGSVYLVYNDNQKECVMITDLVNPKKEILNDKWLLKHIKTKGYKNIKEIQYERDGRITKVSIADYYYENAKELDEVA